MVRTMFKNSSRQYCNLYMGTGEAEDHLQGRIDEEESHRHGKGVSQE
jgi:hypothetical protein